MIMVFMLKSFGPGFYVEKFRACFVVVFLLAQYIPKLGNSCLRQFGNIQTLHVISVAAP